MHAHQHLLRRNRGGRPPKKVLALPLPPFAALQMALDASLNKTSSFTRGKRHCTPARPQDRFKARRSHVTRQLLAFESEAALLDDDAAAELSVDTADDALLALVASAAVVCPAAFAFKSTSGRTLNRNSARSPSSFGDAECPMFLYVVNSTGTPASFNVLNA